MIAAWLQLCAHGGGDVLESDTLLPILVRVCWSVDFLLWYMGFHQLLLLWEVDVSGKTLSALSDSCLHTG